MSNLIELDDGEFLDINEAVCITTDFTYNSDSATFIDYKLIKCATNFSISLLEFSNWHKIGGLWLNFDQIKDIKLFLHTQIYWLLYIINIDDIVCKYYTYKDKDKNIDGVMEAFKAYNNQNLKTSEQELKAFLDIEI